MAGRLEILRLQRSGVTAQSTDAATHMQIQFPIANDGPHCKGLEYADFPIQQLRQCCVDTMALVARGTLRTAAKEVDLAPHF